MCTHWQALRDQLSMVTRSSDGDKHRIEALGSKVREGESLAAELATAKLRLASTEGMLRDARTELTVATLSQTDSDTGGYRGPDRHTHTHRLPHSQPAPVPIQRFQPFPQWSSFAQHTDTANGMCEWSVGGLCG